MSVAGSQQRTLLRLLGQLRPYWRTDRNLPARVQNLLTGNRAFGSRDRRLYRELIYTTLRYLPWIEPLLETEPESALRIVAWLAAEVPATARLREAVLGDWPACPNGAAEKAATLASLVSANTTKRVADDLLPAWFRSHCPRAFDPAEVTALLSRAPLWLRLQTDDEARVFSEFDELGWRWERSAPLASAIRILDEVDVTKSRAFEAGMVEVQDLGSQLLLETLKLDHDEHWLDACAGAGGKTLQLARLLGPQGHVDAHDIRPAALRELSARAQRAQLRNITTLEQQPSGFYDGVLVDAPCTGSGTWRRAPHLKWTTTAQAVNDAALLQQTLLTRFSQQVRPGGRLVYATCSLSRRENHEVAAHFLLNHTGFKAEEPSRTFGACAEGEGVTFLPSLHDNDGFFVAAFRRIV